MYKKYIADSHFFLVLHLFGAEVILKELKKDFQFRVHFFSPNYTLILMPRSKPVCKLCKIHPVSLAMSGVFSAINE